MSKRQTVSDLISRKEAIDAIDELAKKYFDRTVILQIVKDSIEALPSAVPTPHGKLVDIDAMIDRFWDGDYMGISCRELKKIPVIVKAEAYDE